MVSRMWHLNYFTLQIGHQNYFRSHLFSNFSTLIVTTPIEIVLIKDKIMNFT